jgi:phosphate transport system permease protein
VQPIPEEAGALGGRPGLSLSRLVPRLGAGNLSDRAYGAVLASFGAVIPLLFLAIFLRVGAEALPVLRRVGAAFVTSRQWDPVGGEFGALPFIFGTVASSLLALLIAVPLAPRWLAAPIAFGTELLAAIPSVVYGLWAVFVMVPWLRDHVQAPLAATLGTRFGLFAGPAYGVSILAGGVILAIMIVPFVSAVSREVLAAVPVPQREAALALGATRWEMTWQVVLPYATPGIIGATILGLGRALGETMAITMVIGNRPDIQGSLFAPGYTMASVLANEFSEASDDMHLAALMGIALLLFGITILVNSVARLLVWRVGLRAGR